ncbi:MAG: hypothetical protein IJF90_00225 [Synergistaceae bacterium]|nr:hypothetical protein [Synergistaceae bacterium]MBQ6419171.1 hypothetical protein [Synergistaceae bacterium]
MMKRIMTALLVVLLMSGVGYGAVSDDVYVRKDVYEVQMQSMNAKLDMILELIKEQREEMKAQREEHKAQMKELKDEMNGIREDVKVQVKELRDEMNGIREDVKVQVKELKDEMNGIREEVKVQVKELKDEMSGIREEMKAHVKESQEEHKAIRNDIAELTRVVSVLSARVDGLDARMGDMRSNLEGRMSDLHSTIEGRVGDLRNDIYLGLVILGIVVGLPAVQKALQKWEEKKAARNASQLPFTLDDVRRLIEENNAKLMGKLQA